MGHSGVGLTDPAAIDALLVMVKEKFEVFNQNVIDLREAVALKTGQASFQYKF